MVLNFPDVPSPYSAAAAAAMFANHYGSSRHHHHVTAAATAHHHQQAYAFNALTGYQNHPAPTQYEFPSYASSTADAYGGHHHHHHPYLTYTGDYGRNAVAYPGNASSAVEDSWAGSFGSSMQSQPLVTPNYRTSPASHGSSMAATEYNNHQLVSPISVANSSSCLFSSGGNNSDYGSGSKLDLNQSIGSSSGSYTTGQSASSPSATTVQSTVVESRPQQQRTAGGNAVVKTEPISPAKLGGKSYDWAVKPASAYHHGSSQQAAPGKTKFIIFLCKPLDRERKAKRKKMMLNLKKLKKKRKWTVKFNKVDLTEIFWLWKSNGKSNGKWKMDLYICSTYF